MGVCNVRGDVLGHARATNEERNVDVLLVAAALAWIETMVANVEAVVRGVNDVLDESAMCVEFV